MNHFQTKMKLCKAPYITKIMKPLLVSVKECYIVPIQTLHMGAPGWLGQLNDWLLISAQVVILGSLMSPE